MKIGIIKETKDPVDNRVALTPSQVALLNERYPNHRIVVQSSDIRAYTDEEYRQHRVEVVDDLSDCDVLVGWSCWSLLHIKRLWLKDQVVFFAKAGYSFYT